MAVICGILAILPLCTAPSFASEKAKAAQLQEGQNLAEAHCSPCHAIGKDDDSPTRTNENTAFRDLHKRFPIAMLKKAAQTGTIEGHDEMPAFDFSSEEIKSLLAYIDSLSPKGAGKYLP